MVKRLLVVAFLLPSCATDDHSDRICCGEGETRCSGDAIILCIGDCIEKRHECSDVCSDAGFQYTTGCDFDYEMERDVCYCTDNFIEPCECAFGDYACWNDEFLLTCEDGCHFVARSCIDYCETYSPGTTGRCGPDYDGTRFWCICE